MVPSNARLCRKTQAVVRGTFAAGLGALDESKTKRVMIADVGLAMVIERYHPLGWAVQIDLVWTLKLADMGVLSDKLPRCGDSGKNQKTLRHFDSASRSRMAWAYPSLARRLISAISSRSLWRTN